MGLWYNYFNVTYIPNVKVYVGTILYNYNIILLIFLLRMIFKNQCVVLVVFYALKYNLYNE